MDGYLCLNGKKGYFFCHFIPGFFLLILHLNAYICAYSTTDKRNK